MFVTVRYGAGQMLILNHFCRIVNFIEHIKQMCVCDTKACVDLIDESGNLMNLSLQQNSLQCVNNILKERGKYILIKVIKQDDSDTIIYESMLKNIEHCHPAVAEQLRKLSNPKAKDKKEQAPKKSRFTKEVIPNTPFKSKSAFGIKKNPSFTQKTL
ncbi:uncharacterized protein C22orf15 isoform X1 [Rhincodon typus]|uniref:uncharacterized protein C22orf15 isoform X1 n=2 Tax=Rhincodon typus TaxID=259920 RepID=UPI00202E86F6|nr:uncharacterized protein C22orf15 isoform X1 [Rhincodon typus]XP_048467250.1 uncharacterized protein C22orf15 isoform X1 [Rhincodon typus]